MAFGDVGGAPGELVITCMTPDEGEVSIKKGDAVYIVGPYTVSNFAMVRTPVFGMAMADANMGHYAIPIKVHGVVIFSYFVQLGSLLYGGFHEKGVVASDVNGKVDYGNPNGTGTILKVDIETGKIHVLL